MIARFVIQSEPVEIEAPIEAAWSALVDFQQYGEWNPLCFRLEAELARGAPVRMWINDPRNAGSGPTQLDYVLVELDAPRLLAWEKSFPQVAFTARRDQELVRVGRRTCRYRSIDLYSGPGAEAMMAQNAAWVRQSFDLMAAALKARVEALQQVARS